MTGHSPESWQIERWRQNDSGMRLVAGDGTLIANLFTPEDHALIEAAPKLLRALQEIRAIVRDWNTDDQCFHRIDAIAEIAIEDMEKRHDA